MDGGGSKRCIPEERSIDSIVPIQGISEDSGDSVGGLKTSLYRGPEEVHGIASDRFRSGPQRDGKPMEHQEYLVTCDVEKHKLPLKLFRCVGVKVPFVVYQMLR